MCTDCQLALEHTGGIANLIFLAAPNDRIKSRTNETVTPASLFFIPWYCVAKTLIRR